MLKRSLIAVALLCAAPARADPPPQAPTQATSQQTLQQRVAAELAKAPLGARFGVLVVDEAGHEVVAINPDGRFIPASNTKLFTTAAAYALLPGIDQPDQDGGTAVALLPGRSTRVPDVWLIGRGDARMSSAADCTFDCVAALADAVAARTRRVHDVVGDDAIWPDQRWPAGMSWNNIGTESGAAVAALNLDDNQLPLSITPGAVGQPPVIAAPPYFKLRNEAVTAPAGAPATLAFRRPVNGMELRLYGQVPADAKRWTAFAGVDDPAHFAAWTLRRMLIARGVQVLGGVRTNHRAVGAGDDPRTAVGVAKQETALPPTVARLVPPPLADDVMTINKRSQNLHAQALFRRIGSLKGTGSEGWAAAALGEVLDAAEVPRAGYDFSDGAGMSTYNRVSPRAVVALLRWAGRQAWGAQWRASLPIGGVDGTLSRRFAGTALQGRIWAKTGTLNATTALAGVMRTASGREFSFSIMANDVPGAAGATAAIDAVLLAIAAAN